MTEKQNTFAQMEQNKKIPEEQVEQPHPVKSGEIDLTNFSDTAVGDKVKYTRPDLKGTVDTIEKFQVFMPDFSEEPSTTQSGNGKFWVPEMTLFWESKNEDGVQNKEHVSGAKVWLNKDGNPSNEIAFWYKGGAEADNQSCILWEKVAECLELEPEKLSPRQFVSFLNMKPKFEIIGQKTKNYKAKPGAPAFIYKNMPGKLVK